MGPEQTAVQTLMTPHEVAERLRIEPDTLKKWRSALIGPRFIRVGRSVRYAPEDLTDWMEQQRVDLPD